MAKYVSKKRIHWDISCCNKVTIILSTIRILFLQAPDEEAAQGEELAIIQDSQQQVIFHFCQCQLKANIS